MIYNKFKILRLLKYYIKNYKKRFFVFNGLDKNSIFIDVGGNMGRISQYVSDVFDPKIIEIYEPHSSLYFYLKNKFQSKKNIFIFNQAVSNRNSKGNLYLKTIGSDDLNVLEGSSLEIEKKNINKDLFQEIELIDIQNIIDKYKYIDCIKVDIEGHEYKILDKLIRSKDKIGKLICEFHGTDIDIKKNKNLEFREFYLDQRKIIEKLTDDGWLIPWD